MIVVERSALQAFWAFRLPNSQPDGAGLFERMALQAGIRSGEQVTFLVCDVAQSMETRLGGGRFTEFWPDISLLVCDRRQSSPRASIRPLRCGSQIGTIQGTRHNAARSSLSIST